MKRACLLLLPAMLLIILAASACNDESKPIFTRVRVSPACGVAPLNVETYAAVSGGNESGDPLGGTNNLDITWDFGDGASGTTAINYHQYSEPGDYTITVKAKDPDGNEATSSVPVTVIADSLVVVAHSTPAPGTIAVGDTVQFGLTAQNCEINYPEELGDAVKMRFRWEMGDTAETVFAGEAPSFMFSEAGEYAVQLTVTYPAQAVTRITTLNYTVVEP